MINLIVPSPSQKYFILIEGFLFGPFSLDKNPLPKETVTFQSMFDVLEQGSTLFDENNVTHTKFEGDLTVNPFNSSMQSTPSATKPYLLRFTGDLGIIDAEYGLAFPGACPYDQDFGYKTYRAVTEMDDKSISIIRPVSWSTNYGVLTSITFRKTVFTLTTVTGRTQYYSYTQQNGTVSKDLPKDTSEINSASMMLDYWNRSVKGTVSTRSYYQTAQTGKSSPSFSVQTAKARINSLASSLYYADVKYPQEVHYGELAMKASEKVNANNVNMVAFLRDLRRPWELIPKLKNLRKLKLKGISGEYLKMEYGILPTISDLQAIFRAFNKVAPYIDKHGFSTYNAMAKNSITTDNITVDVEQRIKVAIDDEDSDLIALANKVDSMGFALTFENIWDLIPYSFVIDWFLNIGDFLERADTRLRLLRWNIQYVTMSRKEIKTLPVDFSVTVPIYGALKEVRYSRWTTDHCPVPPLFFQNTITAQNHWLEAGALLMQRRK